VADKRWEDVAQRGCGITILADNQNPTRHVPELPALSGEVELDDLQRSLSTSAVPGFWFT